jgi:hypothetical protein
VIFYSLSQNSQPFDLSYGSLNEQQNFKIFASDLFGYEDFIQDFATNGANLYVASKSFNTSDFNELNNPDFNHISNLYHTFWGQQSKNFSVNLKENPSIELNAIEVSDKDSSLIVGGKLFTGNTYHSFISKIENNPIFLSIDQKTTEESSFSFVYTDDFTEIRLLKNNKNFLGEYSVVDFYGRKRGNFTNQSMLDLNQFEKGIYLIINELDLQVIRFSVN